MFDAFTDPEGQEEFYGQEDPGWIVESDCDLRVGGVWTVGLGPDHIELELVRTLEAPGVVHQRYRVGLTAPDTNA